MKFRIMILTSTLGAALMLPACTPSTWISEAESIAKVALPIVQGVASVVGAGPAVNQAASDVNLIITLFDQYQEAPATGTLQKIQAALNTANADIAQITAAAGIKNAATQSKVAAILQLVTSEFSTIASLIPKASPTPAGVVEPAKAEAALRGASAQGKLPFTAKEFKAQYNRIVIAKTGDAECDGAFAGKEIK